MKFLLSLIICFTVSTGISQGQWIDVGVQGEFAVTTQQDLTILDNGTPIAAYIQDGNLNDIKIQKWDGTWWTNMTPLSSNMITNATELTDIKLLHVGNTPYIGLGDNGTNYEVYKLVSNVWVPIDTLNTKNINYIVGSVDLSISSTLDDIVFSYTVQNGSGDYPETYKYNTGTGLWNMTFGDNLKTQFTGNNYTYFSSKIFNNGINTYYYSYYEYVGESPAFVAKLYKQDGATWTILSVRFHKVVV